MAVQQIIYGCMGLGGDWSSDEVTDTAERQADRALDAAVASGITFFDHADIYRRGKGEALFGRWLRRSGIPRTQLTIQSKCGIRLGESGLPIYYDASAESVYERATASIERLGCEWLDVLLIHRPDPLTDWADTAAGLERLRSEGLIRGVGVSNMSWNQMTELQRHLSAPLLVTQLELSLAKRDFVEVAMLANNGRQDMPHDFPGGTLEYCAQNAVSVQAWSPLAGGRYSSGAAEEPDAATSRLVARLAAEYEASAESVVLGWLMKHPAAISPVIGTTHPGRIANCADAARVAQSMSRTAWYELFMSARGSSVP